MVRGGRLVAPRKGGLPPARHAERARVLAGTPLPTMRPTGDAEADA
jgi:hypothetical protein